MSMYGSATISLRFLLSTSHFPVVGKCCVENKLITLIFPFTSIAFNCPVAPGDLKQPTDAFKVDFKMVMADDQVMDVEIGYVSELEAFVGKGTIKGSEKPYILFNFYKESSPLKKITLI